MDGPLSVYCYLHTMDLLLARYRAKWEKRHSRPFRLETDAGTWVGLACGSESVHAVGRQTAVAIHSCRWLAG